MPSKNWIEHAYPLQLITCQVQGTRHSDRKDMANQLRRVADMIDAGLLAGQEEDDDFGYRFKLETNEEESIFPDHKQIQESQVDVKIFNQSSTGPVIFEFHTDEVSHKFVIGPSGGAA